MIISKALLGGCPLTTRSKQFRGIALGVSNVFLEAGVEWKAIKFLLEKKILLDRIKSWEILTNFYWYCRIIFDIHDYEVVSGG